MKKLTRKDFLRTSLLGGGAVYLATSSGGLFAQAPAVAKAGVSANSDVRVGIIGFNAQGNGHLQNYLPGSRSKLEGAILAAICDVDDAVLAKGRKAAEGAGLKVAEFKDYRKMLESKDIDAVVIATPNHQHSIMTILALQAGKDVYVEKPLSHNIWEGRQAVEAAKKYTKNIALIGTQNRSSEQIMAAIAMVRSGALGKLKYVTGTCYKPRESIGLHEGPQAIPEGLDYDLWSGPAPVIPSTRNSSKGTVHYDWHWFWAYGGGDISNQGIHQMDVARWMLGAKGLPKDVISFGGRFGYRDDAETPNTLVSVMNYDEAPLIFEVRGLGRNKTVPKSSDYYRKSSIGVVAQCENGYINVDEGGSAVVYDSSGKRVQGFEGSGNGAHRPNWIKALQARKVQHGLLEEGHYSTSLCHLANISYLTGTEKSIPQLAEAVAADMAAKEAYDRTLEHLKANEVDIGQTKSVVGPLLKVDAKTETLVHSDKAIADAANANPIRKRVGRAPFTIPEFTSASVART